jgi:hypothetical protein
MSISPSLSDGELKDIPCQVSQPPEHTKDIFVKRPDTRHFVEYYNISLQKCFYRVHLDMNLSKQICDQSIEF